MPAQARERRRGGVSLKHHRGASDLLHLSDIETSAREGLLLFNSVPEFEIASVLISFEARIDAGDALRGCIQ
jgi:hypothetical protein